MIPEAAITHWRNVVPWPQDAQVEQDLIMSRALVEIFGDARLSRALLLRGGTALYKLVALPPRRYSEDIDLVQAAAGPIGAILDAIRERLDPFLGKPRRENNPGNVTLRYRVDSEIPPVVPLRLKVEINTREHFAGYGVISRPFRVQSPWFEGEAQVQTYALDELLGTKLRALFQRRKGRDLFDLWAALNTSGEPRRIVEAFRVYMKARALRSPVLPSRRTSPPRSAPARSTTISGHSWPAASATTLPRPVASFRRSSSRSCETTSRPDGQARRVASENPPPASSILRRPPAPTRP